MKYIFCSKYVKEIMKYSNNRKIIKYILNLNYFGYFYLLLLFKYISN